MKKTRKPDVDGWWWINEPGWDEPTLVLVTGGARYILGMSGASELIEKRLGEDVFFIGPITVPTFEMWKFEQEVPLCPSCASQVGWLRDPMIGDQRCLANVCGVCDHRISYEEVEI